MTNAGATRRPGTGIAKSAAVARQHCKAFQENSGSDAFVWPRFVATSSESFFGRFHLARSLRRTFLPVAGRLKPIPVSRLLIEANPSQLLNEARAVAAQRWRMERNGLRSLQFHRSLRPYHSRRATQGIALSAARVSVFGQYSFQVSVAALWAKSRAQRR
jgi:hypothetical protein